MILHDLRQALLSKAREWAKTKSVVLPENLPLICPPSHTGADLSLPWAMSIGKLARQNPLGLAQELGRVLEGIQGARVLSTPPPGFINLKLSEASLYENLRSIISEPAAYGRDPDASSKSVLVEFVSANPTGPLHLASGRGATLGDSLVRVLRRLGRKAAAEYYVNDAGGRVELLGQSVKARYEQIHGKDSNVPEGGYQGEYLKDIAASAPAEAAAWDAASWGRYAMGVLLASHKDDMEAFGTAFDRWYHESELYAKGAVEATLAALKRRGMVYEKDGAIWLGTAAAEGSADDKDRVLVKSDGRATYFLPDIAYHKDKYDRGFDELIDIFGADHHGYVPRLKAAIAALGHPPDSCHAIVHQLIHLYRGKEAVKMSKRAGEFVRLREVVDEVGKDACRFFFAMRTPDSHLNFDLELAKKQSSENPVYYCQYVHARICSIFKEAAKQGLWSQGSELPVPEGGLLGQPEERAILLKLAWFPEILKNVEKELSPHPLASYILELAGLFHPFYEKCRVVDTADAGLSRARLLLCAGVRDVIAEGLGLIGVSAPQQM